MKHLTRLVSATALAAALATAACKPGADATDGNAQMQMALPALPATLPLEAGAATEIAPAPSASDLPDARPLKLARVADQTQAYGYADAAYSYDEALGDAPPDYGFDYDGADPWAWQGYDDSLMVAEPIDDGYRYYYYRPGADEPYFVRDPFYSYGYANGLLAVVYGADGGIVPYADYGPRLIYASRYYSRGRQLWGASRRTKRQPVIAANWLRQRPVIVASRDRWASGRARQPDWRRFAETDRPRQTAYWSAEQVRRQADARRFEGWREQGFRAAPPPRAIPVQWEKAKWAQDDRRYRPAAAALKDRDDRQNAGRRDDRVQADQRDARQERQEDSQQQAQRDLRQVERQAQNNRPNRDQSQPDRHNAQQAQQAQQREQRQAERQQTQQSQQRDARQAQQREVQQAQRQQQQAQQRDAQQAQRQQQQAARQQQQREARQAQQPQQRPIQQVERRQQQQAERAQQQQSQRREAQQAARQQQQTEARQAQQAERQQAQQAQRQQTQQAARQQQQAERQQAGQAQRQQAEQAGRQQQQAQQRQQQQAQQREQQQAQRQQMQQQRQERRDARGPGPN